jgi:hypothetical protein
MVSESTFLAGTDNGELLDKIYESCQEQTKRERKKKMFIIAPRTVCRLRSPESAIN